MVAVCAAAVAYSWLEGDRDRFVIRAIVYGGWLASLVLHEFSHSLVAYLGGDREVRPRGFLTLNPLKFMDPVYSIAIPVLFTLIGGVPIIAGRTLIDRSLCVAAGGARPCRWRDQGSMCSLPLA
jgi:Zn-dependent protease